MLGDIRREVGYILNRLAVKQCTALFISWLEIRNSFFWNATASVRSFSNRVKNKKLNHNYLRGLMLMKVRKEYNSIVLSIHLNLYPHTCRLWSHIKDFLDPFHNQSSFNQTWTLKPTGSHNMGNSVNILCMWLNCKICLWCIKIDLMEVSIFQ